MKKPMPVAYMRKKPKKIDMHQFAQTFKVDRQTKDSKPLHELKFRECHWPQWSEWWVNAPFCGKPCHGDSPYCWEHYRRSYNISARK